MYQLIIKRIIDIILAISLIPLLVIVLIPVAFFIKKEDKGSIFYNANRLGKNMKEFKMYKFRTMIENAPDIRNPDGSTYNHSNDNRVTRIGHFLRKTSIDEIPQILNVLKGDMSFVGPRPSPLGNQENYPEKYLRKFEVQPGITGYNQALLRNASTMDERIANDIFYVDSVSFLLDVKIIFWTIKTVVLSKNINRNK